LTGRLRTAINDLSASWELEPTNKEGEAAQGDALVDQLCYLGATVRDRVRDALHTRVKRAMAVVCTGFSYDIQIKMCMCGECMVYGDDGDNNGESLILLLLI
jgi:hypothetical protein